MSVRRPAIQVLLATTGLLFAAAVHAHPGHGAPEGHVHGLFETLVLIGAVAVGIWIARGKR